MDWSRVGVCRIDDGLRLRQKEGTQKVLTQRDLGLHIVWLLGLLFCFMFSANKQRNTTL